MNYLSLPVFPLAARLDEPPRQRLIHDPRRVELGFGAAPAAGTQAWVKRELRASTACRHSERRTVEAFAGALRGREGAFWLPGYLEAAHILSAPDASSLIVTDQEFTEAFAGAPAVHLWILRADGTEEAVQVSDVQPHPDGEEVTFSEALSASVTPDDLVCRLYLVRFNEDRLAWEIEDHSICRLSLSLVETPTDYASIPAAPSTVPVWLYRIVKRVSRTELYELRLTAAPFSVTWEGDTWQAAPVEHSGLSLQSQGERDSCVFACYAFDGHPFGDWEGPRHWGWPMEVYVLRGRADALTGALDAAPTIVFRGEVEQAQRKNAVIQASLRSPLARPSRVPRFAIQTRCNHVLYDANTCRAPEGDFQIDGEITALDAAEGSVSFIFFPRIRLEDDGQVLAEDGTRLLCEGGTATEPGYFAGGRLETGSGLDAQLRSVLLSTAPQADTYKTTLNLALAGAQTGDTLRAWPGCDRTPGMCAARFANFENYGGMPFTPADNPTIKAIELVNPDIEGGKK